jgi:hypothetical protein
MRKGLSEGLDEEFLIVKARKIIVRGCMKGS